MYLKRFKIAFALVFSLSEENNIKLFPYQSRLMFSAFDPFLEL